MTTRIIGTGSALPQKRVTNEDLSKLMDTNDEWIRTRTGIGERRLADADETIVSLGMQAAEQALQNAGKTPEDIDLILVATCSSEQHFPSAACQIQGALGAKNAVAFDISAACSGFLFALNTAHAYLQAGLCQTALLIGAETLSRTIDWSDRSTCVLFGDGAGACVAERSERGMLGFLQASDGAKGQVLKASASAFPTPASKGYPAQALTMDGQEVFKFAVKTVPEAITSLLEQTNTAPEEIRWFVLHQANIRILQSVAKRLKLPIEKFPVNLDVCGNTSAASIPILLDEMNQRGDLTRGDKIVLSGFGAGLTWGASLLEW